MKAWQRGANILAGVQKGHARSSVSWKASSVLGKRNAGSLNCLNMAMCDPQQPSLGRVEIACTKTPQKVIKCLSFTCRCGSSTQLQPGSLQVIADDSMSGTVHYSVSCTRNRLRPRSTWVCLLLRIPFFACSKGKQPAKPLHHSGSRSS